MPPNLLSALNTSLSILLLLRSGGLHWLLLAVVIAIAGKFLVTYRGHHIFNPSAFGIVMVILVVDGAWVTPGQWGHDIWLALLAAGSGLILLMGPSRMLTTLAFGLVHPLLLLANAAWLGDPWSIPLHQLQNGALLIFAFFMLSDPKTVPSAAVGRILYGSWGGDARLGDRVLSLPSQCLSLCTDPFVAAGTGAQLLSTRPAFRLARHGTLNDATNSSHFHPALIPAAGILF